LQIYRKGTICTKTKHFRRTAELESQIKPVSGWSDYTIIGQLLEEVRNHYHVVWGILAQYVTYHATVFNIKGNRDYYSSNV